MAHSPQGDGAVARPGTWHELTPSGTLPAMSQPVESSVPSASPVTTASPAASDDASATPTALPSLAPSNLALVGVRAGPVKVGSRATLTATVRNCFGGCTFSWDVDGVPVAAGLDQGPGATYFVAVASVGLDLGPGTHAVTVQAVDEQASTWSRSDVIVVRKDRPETATPGDDGPILLFVIAAVVAAAAVLVRPQAPDTGRR